MSGLRARLYGPAGPYPETERPVDADVLVWDDWPPKGESRLVEGVELVGGRGLDGARLPLHSRTELRAGDTLTVDPPAGHLRDAMRRARG